MRNRDTHLQRTVNKKKTIWLKNKKMYFISSVQSLVVCILGSPHSRRYNVDFLRMHTFRKYYYAFEKLKRFPTFLSIRYSKHNIQIVQLRGLDLGNADFDKNQGCLACASNVNTCSNDLIGGASILKFNRPNSTYNQFPA